jgi:TatD DNase family protein
MIDTHVHLNNRDLARDLNGVLTRAEEAGVRQFVVVGYDLASSAKAVEQAQSDTRIFATVGIHPHDATSYGPEAKERLREWASDPRVVAIGEIGLDFYRDLSPRPAQYDAFRAQIRLAREVGLPIVIHSRDASDEVMDLLEAEAEGVSVLLHCFAMERGHAERAWKQGWLLGVGGTLTYKKNDALREVIRNAPQESIVLETDAPYLTPEPHRGKYPNEPARVPLVAARIASLRGETAAEVETYTDENARRFFFRLARPVG